MWRLDRCDRKLSSGPAKNDLLASNPGLMGIYLFAYSFIMVWFLSQSGDMLADTNMEISKLIQKMFTQGLGQHLILHIAGERIYLGYLSYEKGKLVIRDKGFLEGVKPAQLAPCWDYGLLGCVYSTRKFEWQSLTFSGLEHCDIPPNLSDTRQSALYAAENQYGENLVNFTGSVYRGYQLMLDNHHLPVILLKPMKIKSGETGLAVSDLRAASIDLGIIRNVNEIVRDAVEKQLLLGVEDVQVNPDQFEEMFGSFLAKNKKQ